MLTGVALASHGNRRIGVCAAVGVDQERVALGVVLAALEMLRNVNQPAVGRAAFADADALGDDVAGRLVRAVNHFCAGILMLAVAGQRNADHFAARFPALQDDARIFHRQARSDIAVDPFNLGLFVRQAALGDEIENVLATNSGR